MTINYIYLIKYNRNAERSIGIFIKPVVFIKLDATFNKLNLKLNLT